MRGIKMLEMLREHSTVEPSTALTLSLMESATGIICLGVGSTALPILGGSILLGGGLLSGAYANANYRLRFSSDEYWQHFILGAVPASISSGISCAFGTSWPVIFTAGAFGNMSSDLLTHQFNKKPIPSYDELFLIALKSAAKGGILACVAVYPSIKMSEGFKDCYGYFIGTPQHAIGKVFIPTVSGGLGGGVGAGLAKMMNNTFKGDPILKDVKDAVILGAALGSLINAVRAVKKIKIQADLQQKQKEYQDAKNEYDKAANNSKQAYEDLQRAKKALEDALVDLGIDPVSPEDLDLEKRAKEAIDSINKELLGYQQEYKKILDQFKEWHENGDYFELNGQRVGWPEAAKAYANGGSVTHYKHVAIISRTQHHYHIKVEQRPPIPLANTEQKLQDAQSKLDTIQQKNQLTRSNYIEHLKSDLIILDAELQQKEKDIQQTNRDLVRGERHLNNANNKLQQNISNFHQATPTVQSTTMIVASLHGRVNKLEQSVQQLLQRRERRRANVQQAQPPGPRQQAHAPALAQQVQPPAPAQQDQPPAPAQQDQPPAPAPQVQPQAQNLLVLRNRLITPTMLKILQEEKIKDSQVAQELKRFYHLELTIKEFASMPTSSSRKVLPIRQGCFFSKSISELTKVIEEIKNGVLTMPRGLKLLENMTQKLGPKHPIVLALNKTKPFQYNDVVYQNACNIMCL
jgi:hypothetical protein